VDFSNKFSMELETGKVTQLKNGFCPKNFRSGRANLVKNCIFEISNSMEKNYLENFQIAH